MDDSSVCDLEMEHFELEIDPSKVFATPDNKISMLLLDVVECDD